MATKYLYLILFFNSIQFSNAVEKIQNPHLPYSILFYNIVIDLSKEPSVYPSVCPYISSSDLTLTTSLSCNAVIFPILSCPILSSLILTKLTIKIWKLPQFYFYYVKFKLTKSLEFSLSLILSSYHSYSSLIPLLATAILSNSSLF